jgi:hypothetical protein
MQDHSNVGPPKKYSWFGGPPNEVLDSWLKVSMRDAVYCVRIWIPRTGTDTCRLFGSSWTT